MMQRILLILVLILLITSCGGAAPATQAPAETQAPATEAAATEEPATQEPAATEPPALQSLEPSTQAAPQSQATATLEPTFTQVASTSTDTPLPTLDLPTEVVNPPAQMAWDGAPTYPAESASGFAFRVMYDPELWALTNDQFGFPALGHRNIPNCVISVTSGRGLPLSMTVEHDLVNAGSVTFDVGNVFENGVLKFVTYTGGDGTIITGFQVSFEEQANECRADAVRVVFTLRSVPTSQATPTP